jgi:L-asparaginase II
VYAVGLVDRGIGVAWKTEDGEFRALPPAVIATLVEMKALPESAAASMPQFRTPEVRNYREILAGDITAEVDGSARAAFSSVL